MSHQCESNNESFYWRLSLTYFKDDLAIDSIFLWTTTVASVLSLLHCILHIFWSKLTVHNGLTASVLAPLLNASVTLITNIKPRLCVYIIILITGVSGVTGCPSWVRMTGVRMSRMAMVEWWQVSECQLVPVAGWAPSLSHWLGQWESQPLISEPSGALASRGGILHRVVQTKTGFLAKIA